MSDHPGKCWVYEQEYSPGNHFIKNKCEKLFCGKKGLGEIHGWDYKHSAVSYFSLYSKNILFYLIRCGVRDVAPDGFHHEIDKSRKYPYCCPKLVKDWTWALELHCTTTYYILRINDLLWIINLSLICLLSKQKWDHYLYIQFKYIRFTLIIIITVVSLNFENNLVSYKSKLLVSTVSRSSKI